MSAIIRQGARGMTLIEIIAATVVIAVVLLGTMTAFITAARIVGKENLFALAEANGLLRETADERRNGVYRGTSTVQGMVGSGWQMVETINTPDLPHGKRCLMVTDNANYDPSCAPNCACSGNCYEIKATVCWNNEPTCPC